MEHEKEKEDHREIHVAGTDRFRIVALFGSLILSALSILLSLLDPRTCEAANLETAIYACFGV
jgi:hypothetical protein